MSQAIGRAQLELLQAELERLRCRAEEKRRLNENTAGACMMRPMQQQEQQTDENSVDMQELSRKLLDIVERREGEVEEEEEEDEKEEAFVHEASVQPEGQQQLDGSNLMFEALQNELRRLQLRKEELDQQDRVKGAIDHQ